MGVQSTYEFFSCPVAVAFNALAIFSTRCVLLCTRHGKSVHLPLLKMHNFALYSVRVCCHPIYSGRQTIYRYNMWTHQPGSHRSCACLNFLSHEGFSRPFPSSTVKSNLVYPRINRPPLVGHDVRENPTSCDCAEIRTHVPTSGGFRVAN